MTNQEAFEAGKKAGREEVLKQFRELLQVPSIEEVEDMEERLTNYIEQSDNA
jgi:hypothetical protein